MLNFVLNLQTYVTNEVIEPNWHTLMTTLKNVQNIDEGKKFLRVVSLASLALVSRMLKRQP